MRMGNFRRSWSLVKASIKVVNQDRRLIVLPLISVLAVLVTAAVFLGGVWQIKPFFDSSTETASGSQAGLTLTPLTGALLLLGYLAVTFIGMFFNAALVVAANERLSGGTPTVRSALAGAAKHAGPIALWAMFSATISLAIRAASERVGLVGRIVVSIIGVVWSVATFFVMPVMVIEGVGVNDAFHRSKSLMRSTWGEQIVGEGMVSIIAIPVFLLLVVVSAILLAVVPVLGVIVFVVGLLLVVSVSNMVSVVFSTVLYKFAQTGLAPAGFTAADLNGSFHQRKAKRSRFGR